MEILEKSVILPKLPENNLAFRWACQNGKLEDAKRLVDKHGLTILDVQHCDNYAFRYACIYGHLEVTKWLVDTFKLTINDVRSKYNEAIRFVCYNAHLNILQFLIECFDLSNDDYNESVCFHWNSLMETACIKKKNEFMVSWFVTKFPLNDIPEKCKEYVAEVMERDGIMVKVAIDEF